MNGTHYRTHSQIVLLFHFQPTLRLAAGALACPYLPSARSLTLAPKGRNASVTVSYNAWLDAASAMDQQFTVLNFFIVQADESLDMPHKCFLEYWIAKI